MNCPYPDCRQSITPGAGQCPVCHRKLENCGKCHTENRALAKFCRGCGEWLSATHEWPVYRNDSAFDAYSDRPLEFDAVAGTHPRFEKLWPDLNLSEEILAAPVVEHGLLVVCSRRGGIHLINRFTGEPLVDFRLGGAGEYSVLFCGETLVASGPDQIAAYDLLSGFNEWTHGRFRLNQNWHCTTPGMAGLLQPLSLAPGNGVPPAVIVCVCRDGGAAVSALDLKTGEPRWEEPVMLPATASAVAVADDGCGYAVTQNGHVYRIDLTSGQWLASQPASTGLRVDIAPVWIDQTLYFIDEESRLCACHTGGARMKPAQASDLRLLGAKGLAGSRRGILVAYGAGLAKLSLGGQLIWRADTSMGAIGGSPVIAGDCGFGVGLNRSVLYFCDFKGNFLRFDQFLIGEDANWAAPALAGGVIYTCSLHGSVSATRICAAA